MTGTTIDRGNLKLLEKQPLTPRNDNNELFHTTDKKRDDIVSHLSFRSPPSNKIIWMEEERMGDTIVPYPKDGLMTWKNTFGSKSLSTQEYIPIRTSTELSKAIRNISKDSWMSSEVYNVEGKRSSLNSNWNIGSSYNNQSTFAMKKAGSKDK